MSLLHKGPVNDLPPNERWLSTADVFKMFGISPSTLNRLVDAKEITRGKLLRKNLYNMQELLDYIKRGVPKKGEEEEKE